MLLEIVNETFDWAARRGVDLASLTDLGQLLPAAYFSANTGGPAGPDTISTDFGGTPPIAVGR